MGIGEHYYKNKDENANRFALSGILLKREKKRERKRGKNRERERESNK